MTDALLPETAGYAGQPLIEVERDGVHYTLLGTAHVSKASIEAVHAAIDSGRFDAVAVELDEQRHKALTQPDALAQLDLVKVIREKKVAPFAANLALAAYQRRLAEQLSIEPGAELKAAATEAVARGLSMQLIDRDVGITFRRIMQGLSWWDRAKLIGSVAAGLFASEDVSEDDIERLRFNTAIAKLYTFVGSLAEAIDDPRLKTDPAWAGAVREAIDILLRMISPMMPHLAEQCWEVMGGEGLVSEAAWPEADPALLVEDSMTLPVQINGKKRADVTVGRNAPNPEIEAAVLALDAVKTALAGATPRKIIVVPQRIVNVVV